MNDPRSRAFRARPPTRLSAKERTMQELDNFIQSMKDEAGHLISFAGMEEEMQRLVVERKWDGLESTIVRLRKKSELVDRAEDGRVRSFQILQLYCWVRWGIRIWGM